MDDGCIKSTISVIGDSHGGNRALLCWSYINWDNRTGRYSQALVGEAISKCCEEHRTSPLLQTEQTNETLGI